MTGAVYCQSYPLFGCEPATAEVEGPDGVWFPACERCMQIAFEADHRVRKLQQTNFIQPAWPNAIPPPGVASTAPTCGVCGQPIIGHHICPGPMVIT